MQGYFIAVSLQAQPGMVVNPGPFFLITSVVTLVGGVMFLVWLVSKSPRAGSVMVSR